MLIEIKAKEPAMDARREWLQQEVNEELGLKKAEVTETSDIYSIKGSFSTKEAEEITDAITDKIIQNATINSQLQSKGAWILLTRYKPGITDPAEQSIMQLISDLGLAAESANIIQKYAVKGVTKEQAKAICEQILANENTQQYEFGFETLSQNSLFTPSLTAEKEEDNSEDTKKVAITKASDRELEKISQQGILALSLEEMKAIQAHYRKLKGSQPMLSLKP